MPAAWVSAAVGVAGAVGARSAGKKADKSQAAANAVSAAAAARAAARAEKLGQAELDFSRQQYDENQPLGDNVSAQQMGIARRAGLQGDDYYNYGKSYRPVEQSMMYESMGLDPDMIDALRAEQASTRAGVLGGLVDEAPSQAEYLAARDARGLSSAQLSRADITASLASKYTTTVTDPAPAAAPGKKKKKGFLKRALSLNPREHLDPMGLLDGKGKGGGAAGPRSRQVVDQVGLDAATDKAFGEQTARQTAYTAAERNAAGIRSANSALRDKTNEAESGVFNSYASRAQRAANAKLDAAKALDDDDYAAAAGVRKGLTAKFEANQQLYDKTSLERTDDYDRFDLAQRQDNDARVMANRRLNNDDILAGTNRQSMIDDRFAASRARDDADDAMILTNRRLDDADILAGTLRRDEADSRFAASRQRDIDDDALIMANRRLDAEDAGIIGGDDSYVYNQRRGEIDAGVGRAVADSQGGYTRSLNQATREGLRYGRSSDQTGAMAMDQASAFAGASNSSREYGINRGRELASTKLDLRRSAADLNARLSDRTRARYLDEISASDSRTDRSVNQRRSTADLNARLSDRTRARYLDETGFSDSRTDRTMNQRRDAMALANAQTDRQLNLRRDAINSGNNQSDRNVNRYRDEIGFNERLTDRAINQRRSTTDFNNAQRAINWDRKLTAAGLGAAASTRANTSYGLTTDSGTIALRNKMIPGEARMDGMRQGGATIMSGLNGVTSNATSMAGQPNYRAQGQMAMSGALMGAGTAGLNAWASRTPAASGVRPEQAPAPVQYGPTRR